MMAKSHKFSQKPKYSINVSKTNNQKKVTHLKLNDNSHANQPLKSIFQLINLKSWSIEILRFNKAVSFYEKHKKYSENTHLKNERFSHC